MKRLEAYFARHAQVLVGSLGRLAAAPVASLLTMTVIAVALTLPLGLHVLLQNARAASAGWNDAFNLSVYLAKSASDARAGEIAARLRARGDVAAVKVVLAPQALAEFRQYSGFGDALDALQGNPLPDTLIVTPAISASTTAGTAALKQAIAAMPDVDRVQLDTEWVARLTAMIELLQRLALVAGGMLGLGVVLIVGNTIRLDIDNRRAEIEVMKLVGGTDGFARRPFLYGGLWYGLGGGALALLLVAVATAALSAPIARLAGLYGSAFRLSGLDAATSGGVLLASGLLGWLGSWIVATRHIRAINPA
ncbi:MAG: permease-like cell division protein FtsX [Gammaproteobacteria bacterium]|nr:permease-like cell division protein FtsX [Gammaproteobacteria bacterium]